MLKDLKRCLFQKFGICVTFRNNYFIGGNFENAVGIFVGGKKSLLLSIFESETKKNVNNQVKMYDF